MKIKFAQRTQREQRLILGGGGILILIAIFVFVDSRIQRYDQLNNKIANNKNELIKISHLQSQHQETNQQLSAIQAQLEKMPKDFSVMSFIEDLANKENIRENIGSQKPKKIKLNDEYDETYVEIQMDNVELPKLVKFINKIENSGHLLKIKRLRIKTRYDDRNLLSVTMQVTTYKKKT